MSEDSHRDTVMPDVDAHDLVRMRASRVKHRVIFAVIGVLSAVISFIAGTITRDVFPGSFTSYPYAIGAAIPVAGSTSNRRLVAAVFALLAIVSFTLGVLLTEGRIQDLEPSLGVAPEYGVYRPRR